VMIVRISALQKENRKAEIRAVTASATNRVAAIQFPLLAILLIAGRDLIVLLYTKTYEQSASIFLISICLLLLGVVLVDPIIRAFKELRRFVLVTRCVTFVCLFGALAPTIRHFGMIGAAVLAVGVRILEHLIIAWKAAKTVDMSVRDLHLYASVFQAAGISVLAGLVALIFRNWIPYDSHALRIGTVVLCVGAVYLPAMYFLKLPGWDFLSPRQIRTRVAVLLSSLGSERAAS